jgi:hypothetical protein
MNAGLQDVLHLVQDQILAIAILKTDPENRVLQWLIREERQAEQDHSLAQEPVGNAPDRPSSGQEGHFEHRESWLIKDDCLDPYNVMNM